MVDNMQGTFQAAIVEADNVPTENAKPPKKRKSVWLYILLVVLVIALGLVGYFLFSAQNKTKNVTKVDKIYHVGILSGLNLFAPVAESFKKEMEALGYIEGKNIVYDYRKTNFEPEKEKQILDAFVTNNVDLIFCYNTEVALAAKKATQDTSIPVIFANAFIEGTQLVDNLQKPGGNLTGVRYPGTGIALKRFEILQAILPDAKRVWLPYQKGYPYAAEQIKALQIEAKKNNVTLIEFPAENAASLERELEKRLKTGTLGFDAVLYIPESLSTTRAAFDNIAKYTRVKKIPIGGSSLVTDDYGTLFAVTVSPVETGKLGAQLADKVLKGIAVGTIPVASSEPIIKINNRVAKELGISVPEGILNQAAEIIK